MPVCVLRWLNEAAFGKQLRVTEATSQNRTEGVMAGQTIVCMRGMDGFIPFLDKHPSSVTTSQLDAAIQEEIKIL